MENNITAVQFIKEQIELHSDTSFFNIDWDKFDALIREAKEMEKEQIINAYIKGFCNKDITAVCNEDIRAKQYYNETFKSE